MYCSGAQQGTLTIYFVLGLEFRRPLTCMHMRAESRMHAFIQTLMDSKHAMIMHPS